MLLGMLFFGSGTLAQLDDSRLIAPATLSYTNAVDNGDLYFDQHSAKTLETPDLKIGQDSFVYGVATPNVVTTQTLGAMMGGSVDQAQDRKDIIEYSVEPGDTPASIAASFTISLNTLLWANEITKNTVLKTGQELVILPADGLLHIVKPGDALESLVKMYKGNIDDTIAFNSITEGKIFIGDTLFVAGGIMPARKAPVSISTSIGTQNILPDTFFIFPLLKFKVTQGLHYLNGIDIASLDGAGSPVYAAASGIVQHADYDRVGGNRVTILHSNGVVTYYGHLGSMAVKPGDQVEVGQKIGSEGQTGKATGPHVHFQVMGAANFLAKYKVGTIIDVTKN